MNSHSFVGFVLASFVGLSVMAALCSMHMFYHPIDSQPKYHGVRYYHPHFTDEKVEAERWRFAQGHAAGRAKI